ncbi:MAG: hypothetical protein CML80_06390 [Rhodobiaceae bacterium]|nr:hypothetical protein [Rhodobiaceae bacterium]OUT90049.1 MAG: hypothetical protein CBB89_07345 [Rhizobiales bacterium TMED29]HAL85133.1 DUF2062 domain-containing protein [Rhodobiaceae bacterium]
MFKRRKPQSTLEKWQQFIWPREGWTRALKYTWQRTIRLNGSAHSIALGLAAGAFVSASPFMGMHLLIAALIAWLLGGNIIASAVGTWAGNPISFPFIWLATFNIGHLILGTEDKAGDLPELSLGLFIDAPIEALLPVILPMAIGGVVVGIVMAVATYYPSLWGVRFYQKRRRDKLDRAQAGIDNEASGHE